MAPLTAVDRTRLEQLLGMETGYVSDFSNRTFANFVHASVGIDAYGEKYNTGSGSKANRLRALWELEDDAVVGKLVRELCDHVEVVKGPAAERDRLQACRQIADRLLAAKDRVVGPTALPAEGRRSTAQVGPAADARRVFVVHGHDSRRKDELALFLRELGLEPIILHEQANKGRTIIEKFEAHAESVHYAVILLTADDEGRRRADPTQPIKHYRYALKHPPKCAPRARQNVVLELGYFVARLGREGVCVLHEKGVELPSDLHGILYVSLQDKWREDLLRELVEANLSVRTSRAPTLRAPTP